MSQSLRHLQRRQPVHSGLQMATEPTNARPEMDYVSVRDPNALTKFAVKFHCVSEAKHAIPLFVECLSNASVSASYPHQSGGSEFAGATGSAVMLCPRGTMVAGGGLMYTRTDSGNQVLG